MKVTYVNQAEHYKSMVESKKAVKSHGTRVDDRRALWTKTFTKARLHPTLVAI
jgi:hypothetical protein